MNILSRVLGLAGGFVRDQAEDALTPRFAEALGDLTSEQREELARDAEALALALRTAGPGGQPRLKRAARRLAEIVVPVFEKVVTD